MRRAEKQAAVAAIKQSGCVDCGTTEGQLHFDHRPGTEKVGNVADLVAYATVPFEKVLEEIEKCDIRCARCHRLRHHGDPDRCRRGHEFTPENTYTYRGRRICRTCNLLRVHKCRKKQHASH